MFLDEELTQVLFAKEVKTEEDIIDLKHRLLQCMVNRLPEPDEVSIQDFLTEIKRIDNGWRLFVKNHSNLEFKETFWRSYILSKDEYGELKKALGW